jgi:hypothetical protein
VGVHPASAFIGEDGEALHVLHCPWLGTTMALSDRMAALGQRAARAALEGVREAGIEARDVAVFVVLGPARTSFVEVDRERVASAVAREAGVAAPRTLSGSTAFFAALHEADRLLAVQEARAVLIVAVDSAISLDGLQVELGMPPATWVREPPPPSEGAAAVVVMRERDAVRGMSLGRLLHAGVLRGAGCDDDDAVVDGAAMTALLGQAPEEALPIVRVYGQDRVDLLRLHEWTYAAARHAERFHEQMRTDCVEVWTGRLGAAAGAAHLTYGLACERHHATREHGAGRGAFAAWAIAPDGVRGLCVAEATS